MSKLKITTLLLLISFTFITVSGASCTKGADPASLKRVSLKFWTVHDSRDAYFPIIQDYRALHPNVSIDFKQIKPEEYEDELLEAFALDEGPDIFTIHNSWTNKYINLSEPMPVSVKLPFRKTVGSVKKEEVVVVETQKMYSPKQVQTIFGDTVAEDMVLRYNIGTSDKPEWKNGVFGLPLSLDTLVLYYNKDILNNAAIPVPAQYWTDLQNQIEKIRKVDSRNNLLLSAIPLGTARNVVRSFDILSLLMMQLKAEMIIDGGQVNFNKIPKSLAGQDGITQAPGINALEFYISFADPILNSYTWNDDMPDSLQTFIDGRSAYFIGYSYHRQYIESQAPKLNFEIAPMLQVQGYDTVNYASYWAHSVAKKSANKDYAWDFIRFMTTKNEAKKYLDKTNRPTAIRALYDDQLENEDIEVFTEQTLTAKSWYHGKNPGAAEEIFMQMIESIYNAEATAKDVVDLAVQKVQQTMK